MSSDTMPLPSIHTIDSSRVNPYRDKVVDTYDDSPETWRKALGSDSLLYQFGSFDPDELARGAEPGSTGPSELRHLDRQLEIAGLAAADRPPLHRILDLGCGWGATSRYLAERFPECRRIDAINISRRQLEHAAQALSGRDLAGRVNLYLCDGQDVDLLPSPEVPYDLVVARGSYTHFPREVFEASVKAVSQRLRPGGTLLISDTLYKTDLSTYRSAIPDRNDRLACGHRKTPGYMVGVLEEHGMFLQDMRVMPSNAEVTHWFHKVRLNIEQHFPDGVAGPIGQMREMAVSFPATLAADKASAYSLVARRAA